MTAIRETFEESGILICKKYVADEKNSSWASYFGGHEIKEWQKKVHDNPVQFLELCHQFKIYPDIWALHEWSNWLTPSSRPKRFDTIFFLASFQNEPPIYAEKNEVQHYEWATPSEYLENNHNSEIKLPPPQFYEISRLMNFQTIESLVKFNESRAMLGCERFLPYRIKKDKMTVTFLPGDELYPADAENTKDVFGRKVMMLLCLTGIAISYILWAFSSNLLYFIIARFIGGISKGNVSLSMAIIADVSNMKTRGKGMALVGIAFSLGFIIGPMIGAIFALWAKNRTDAWFTFPALFALLLAVLDLIFVAFYFEESLPAEKRAKSIKTGIERAKSFIYVNDLFRFTAVTNLKVSEQRQLRLLGLVYFVYLFIYSGLEFTLTFFTHHVFNYTSMEQGWMFFAIGLTMALIQGGYVRRLPASKTKFTAVLGLWLIIPSFVSIGMASTTTLFYVGLFLFAFSTALVVPCMMTMASQYGSAQQKGAVMGIFRSLGALARAMGPIVASIAFWSMGSRPTYLIGAVGLLWPVLKLQYSYSN
ncbi:tetracycline resistance [Carabus blaptoides fortunei]